MAKSANLVQELTATTGTGTLTLTQFVGFARFADRFAVGDVVPYAIEDGSNWEVGLGTVGASNTLARSVVLETMVAGVFSSSSPTAITLASGAASVRCVSPQQQMDAPRRNVIIGGNFDTNPWQRGTSFVSPPNNTYCADRFAWGSSGVGAVTVSRDATSPSVAQLGFVSTNCLKTVITTAAASPVTTDFGGWTYRIEGYDWAQLAQSYCVLSFWHAHTKAGKYTVSLRNFAADRTCVLEYTQSVSNAWEYSEIIIPPSPSAGTWNYTNGTGMMIWFTMLSGATYNTTPGSWVTGNFLSTVNQVNSMDTVGNQFRIQLVQLERGVIATPFEFRSVAAELALCRRYYERLGGRASYDLWMRAYQAVVSTTIGCTIPFAVEKRATPTVAKVGTWNVNNVAQPGFQQISTTAAALTAAVSAAGDCFFGTNDATTYLDINAEL
jgi:hypothetical protein